MSERVHDYDAPRPEFDLDDVVSFNHEGERLTGVVVRVYNSRELYHVEVDGERYLVDVFSDDPRKVAKKKVDPTRVAAGTRRFEDGDDVQVEIGDDFYEATIVGHMNIGGGLLEVWLVKLSEDLSESYPFSVVAVPADKVFAE